MPLLKVTFPVPPIANCPFLRIRFPLVKESLPVRRSRVFAPTAFPQFSIVKAFPARFAEIVLVPDTELFCDWMLPPVSVRIAPLVPEIVVPFGLKKRVPAVVLASRVTLLAEL